MNDAVVHDAPLLDMPRLLVLIPLTDADRAELAAHFDVLYAPDAQQRARVIARQGSTVRAVLTNGATGLAAEEVDRMPALELAGALGAGYENLALDHARSRGVALCNGAGVNADCVADHAMALLLAAVRAVPRFDAACRAGVWRDALPMRPTLTGRRLGIVGYGQIGAKIARRAAGFEMTIGYHNRTPREGVDARYFDTPLALAQWSDCLVVATPGGAQTQHLIDRAVLDALGPEGFLVNVSRGSVVDTAALAAALAQGALGGAGLDVYEGEPAPPQALVALESVVLTPHVAGTSPDVRAASIRHFIENAARCFAGEPLLTPL
ncbi:2-ketogluconate reductase [Paraburkholderia caffeinitolerans]|uniref:2-ketogluconate reductase n=1 Tax=Paraburkholderia caffeinitolerans TaxID=1723730 RepID=A0A6J5GBA2_9BURK|nr:2-hydroxyacid dehydrogenase [Paraburkholderia caffeinitolerans]CAB3797324.1 2-ketogluconate reductase [Paraburkholderia caffeinitolerans]